MKRLILFLVLSVFMSLLVSGADFKVNDTVYDVLQSDNVNDVFVYDTSDDTVNDLWKVGGNIGKCAMSFDGYNDYISMGNVLGTTGELTLSTWIKPAKLATGALINKYESNSGRRGYALWFSSDGRIRFILGNESNNNYNCFSNTGLGLDEWSYVVATVDSSNVMKVYINGELDNSAQFTGARQSVSNYLFLGVYGYTSPSSLYFNGSMDETQIFNRALTSDEISEMYNRGIADLKSNITSGLVGSWGFDDCVSSGTTVDESGNGNDGTLVNDAASTEKLSWFKEGNFNEKGAYFDGDDDYVNVTDDGSFSFGDGISDEPFSISAWVNMKDTNRFRILGKKFIGAANFEYYFGTTSTDTLTLNLRDGSDTNAYIRSETGCGTKVKTNLLKLRQSHVFL